MKERKEHNETSIVKRSLRSKKKTKREGSPFIREPARPFQKKKTNLFGPTGGTRKKRHLTNRWGGKKRPPFISSESKKLGFTHVRKGKATKRKKDVLSW